MYIYSFFQRMIVSAALYLMANTAWAESYFVTPDTLQEVLAKAEPGDVIELAGGLYAGISFGPEKSGEAEKPLIIRSHDASDPAVLDGLYMDGMRHLKVENLVLDYKTTPDLNPITYSYTMLQNVEDITFDGVIFDGDNIVSLGNHDNGYGSSVGLHITNSRKVTIKNATFTNFYRGMLIAASSDLIIKDNDFTSIHSDAIDFAQVERTLIEGNYFHHFSHAAESAAHPDAIQFWTASTDAPSKDIIIKDNIIYADQSNWIQSIFMRNESVDSGGGGHDMFYKNIEITGNVIIASQLHGITIGETDGLKITHNTLISSQSGEFPLNGGIGLQTPMINISQGAQNVSVTNNIAAQISGPFQKNWNVRDNILFNQQQGGIKVSYQRIFPLISNSYTFGLEGYSYLPNGLAGSGEYGSKLLLADRVREVTQKKGVPRALLEAWQNRVIKRISPVSFKGLNASRIRWEKTPDYINQFQFYVNDHISTDDAEQPLWVLNQSRQKAVRGKAVRLDLNPGSTRLDVTFADSTKEQITIETPQPYLLSFVDGKVMRGGVDLTFGTTPQGEPALAVGNGSDEIKRVLISQLLKNADFPEAQPILSPYPFSHIIRMDVRMKVVSDTAQSGGNIVEIPGIWGLKITSRGSLDVWALSYGAREPISIKTGPLGLNDGKWHNITLLYQVDSSLQSNVGLVTLTVDDHVFGRKNLPGRVKLGPGGSVYFGNTPQEKSFNGFISQFNLIYLNKKVVLEKDMPSITLITQD